MNVECKERGAEGFEDQLTAGDDYEVLEKGANDFLVVNDNDEERWYGAMHFDY